MSLPKSTLVILTSSSNENKFDGCKHDSSSLSIRNNRKDGMHTSTNKNNAPTDFFLFHFSIRNLREDSEEIVRAGCVTNMCDD